MLPLRGEGKVKAECFMVWNIHGIPAALSGESDLVRLASPLFSAFEPSSLAPQVCLHLIPSFTPADISSEEQVFAYESLRVFRFSDGYLFTDGFSVVIGDPAEGRLVAQVHPETISVPRFFSHLFCQIPLLECLRHRGFYSLHAAALVWKGKGILLVGSAGLGKTTTALAFIEAGCQFVGDDTVLLRNCDGQVEALAWSDEFHLDPETATHFPDIAPLVAQGVIYRPGPKRSFSPRIIWQERWLPYCEPHWLFVLERGEPPTRLEPIALNEAIRALLTQSATVFSDRRIAKSHLICLTTLIRQCIPFRLHLAMDFLHDPHQVVLRLLATRE